MRGHKLLAFSLSMTTSFQARRDHVLFFELLVILTVCICVLLCFFSDSLAVWADDYIFFGNSERQNLFTLCIKMLKFSIIFIMYLVKFTPAQERN